MPQFLNTKIKIGCIAPCIGFGGADMAMMGLMKYCHNVDFTGMAIWGDIKVHNLRMYEKALNWSIPIHQQQRQYQLPGVRYYSSFDEAVYNAVKDANIIFTWGQPGLKNYLSYIDLPTVEYIQNEDIRTKEIVLDNLETTHFKVACSKAASLCLPDPERAIVIYNGIDPGRVCPRKGREAQRRQWGIPEENKVALFMGRLVKEKHPEIMLKALRYLTEEWLVVFVGEGEQKEQLKNEADNYFPKRVAFVNPEYHVGDILAAADCFVLPSDFEGHPLALMEAMLAGTPCIYTDFGVMQELHAEYGELGTMVKKNQEADIYSEAILQSSSEEALQKAKTATQTVWNKFTLPTIANQWEALFEEILFRWYRERRINPIYPV